MTRGGPDSVAFGRVFLRPLALSAPPAAERACHPRVDLLDDAAFASVGLREWAAMAELVDALA